MHLPRECVVNFLKAGNWKTDPIFLIEISIKILKKLIFFTKNLKKVNFSLDKFNYNIILWV